MYALPDCRDCANLCFRFQKFKEVTRAYKRIMLGVDTPDMSLVGRQLEVHLIKVNIMLIVSVA